MAESETWTLPQVARRVGLEYRTLHMWVRRGLIRPSVAANGAGHPASLTEDDLTEVARLARLRRAGLSMAGLERAVKEPQVLLADVADALAGCAPEERDTLSRAETKAKADGEAETPLGAMLKSAGCAPEEER